MQEDTQKDIQTKTSLFGKPWVQSVTGIITIALILGGVLFYKSYTSHISIENSMITAPTISLGPDVSGTLDQVYVKVGDTVLPNTPLVRVGTETVSSQVGGVITAVDTTLGESVNPGQHVVSMINPSDLKVVGEIDENKGLSQIQIGQPVTFTVDAFGSKTYTGIVDQISPTANNTGVAFSISDQRPTQQFDISVRFDVVAHPEFKNGMSAKMYVYTK